MNTETVIAALRAAYPRQDFPDETQRVYARYLAGEDPMRLTRACDRLIRRSTFLPSIAEILLEVAEEYLGLPTAAEAWDIALRGDLRAAPSEVQASTEAVGGRWTLLHSDESMGVMRAQFTSDYESRRRRSLAQFSGAGARHDLAALDTPPLEIAPSQS